MNDAPWKFFIDVGGTFTDVVAIDPEGNLFTHKLLSSGANRADIQSGSNSSTVEEAPVIAIRYLMGLNLTDPIGNIDVRLGTTRATNALLERKGADVAWITTKGFKDALKIGHQDRPDLFKLQIIKRDELTHYIIEIDERLDAQGNVLQQPNLELVKNQLLEVKQQGIGALAICLLHAHINPTHEEQIAAIAESIGFENISLSSKVSRMEGFVSRSDTTVVDAYLSPVIQNYVASLRRSMPQARLHLMTSNGGLVEADSIHGKDTILSGPAGGVAGCAHIARQAGFDQAIGFDMGGTSTDVCRIDPPPATFEYQNETVKAGVRIKTPMLAVETVAAGGGSICTFDGQKLSVGPQSAGADPGPACYGRGGPLTITDMNVWLGRVNPEYFPFQLDRDVIEKKLLTLCQQIQRESNQTLSPIELASGFLQIANTNMASAIKRISLEKGYDAREYTLVTFGGAGGQHACAIARMLGINCILQHPLAGILSAVGIGVADVKRIGQHSVHFPLDHHTDNSLTPIFSALTDELRNELLHEGIQPEEIVESNLSIDLCYTGQATWITIPAKPIRQVRENFEQRHRQLYGYLHENRAIEIRIARVEVKAVSQSVNLQQPIPVQDTSSSPSTTEMIVDGVQKSVPLFLRTTLYNKQKITGPAMVIEETSTVVVDDGWEAVVDHLGNLILSDIQPQEKRESGSTEADPIQLELFNHRFQSIATQMGTTLQRTALSTNVKERLDFSCAIFTPQGDLVVNAPHIPVHLGGMSDCVQSLMEDVGAFEPGDVYVTNDPYRGGSHLNDVTVITPVHDSKNIRILFFVANRAHHAEIGGTQPGSMPPDSTTLAQEGVLIRAFRWIRHGTVQHDTLRKIFTSHLYPSRSPDENLADIAAQVAANQRGAQELIDMIDRYDIDVVANYMQHIQNTAEKKMRSALSAMKDGNYCFTDQMDDGTSIQLAITIKNDAATLDFSGTDAVHPRNLNANRAIVSSAVLYCLRCLIDEDIPLNAGVLAPIDIILPECFLNPPFHVDPNQCPAVGGGNVETSQRIVDTIFGALQMVAASSGTMNNVLIGDETFGYYETICGGSGAGPDFHGTDAVHTNMTNTRLTDPEVLESRYPVRLHQFSIRDNSGGKGKFNGGNGVIRKIEFLKPLNVSLLTQRRTVAPYGLCGGENGKPGINKLLRKASGKEEMLGSITHVQVLPGDQLTIETPGGGGYGKIHTTSR